MTDIARLGYAVDSSQLRDATRDLDKNTAAAARTEKATEKLERSYARVAKSIGTMVGTGIVVAATALTGLTAKAINHADKIYDLSQRYEISTETLSGWGYALKQSGSDLDQMTAALPILQKNLAAATKEGSSQAKLFAALGVDVLDPLTGKLRRVEDALPDLADRFKTLQNPTMESAAALRLLGRNGDDLLEFMNRGSGGIAELTDRAEKLGGVIGGETAQRAAEFKDQLEDLRVMATGLGLQLAEALLPELMKLVQNLTEVTSDGERTKKFMNDLTTVVSGTATVFEFAAGQVSVMIGQLAALKTVADGVIDLDWEKISRGVAMGMAAQAQSAENLARLASGEGKSKKDDLPPGLVQEMDISLGAPMTPEEQAKLERQLSGFFSGDGKDKKDKKSGTSEAERLQAAYERLNASLDEQIALFGQTGEAARVRYEVENGELAKLSASQKQVLIEKAEWSDWLQEMADIEEVWTEAKNESAQADLDRTMRAQEMLDTLEEERITLGMTADELEVYNNLKWAGVSANSEFGREISASTIELQRQREAMQDQIDMMDAVRDATGGIFRDLREGVNFWDAIGNAVNRVADRLTELALSKVIEQLFGQQGSSGGGAWGEAIGSIFGAMFGGGRALGGDVRDDRFYRVGERNRPELFNSPFGQFLIPGDRGNVEPMSTAGAAPEMPAMGPQNIYVQGRVTSRTARQIQVEASRRQRVAIARLGG